MRGSAYCHSHNSKAVKSGGAPRGNKNAATPGSLYSKYLTPEENLMLQFNPDHPDLDNEIAIARVALARALEQKKSEDVSRALMVVARLIDMQRKFKGEKAAGISQALEKLLDEITTSNFEV
jgi:uncharacterized protein YjcR